MLHGMLNTRSRSFTVLLAVLTAFFVLSILLFPDRAFRSSLQGLSLWWNIVFPALLPFLILSELLGGFGFIRGTGVLFDPLMRLLFRLPGASGWAVAMGGLAGGPSGAHVALQLRTAGTVSREQGERLLALSHMSSPFLMLSVIGTGFLHQPAAGTLIAVIHYLSAFGAALLFRFRSRSEGAMPRKQSPKSSVWTRFLEEMHEARLKDGRSFGKLLGDAVSNSIQTLMLIGGCIMMFSVLLHTLELSLVTQTVNNALQHVLRWVGYLSAGKPDWLPSLLEQHLGAYAFSQLNLPESALIWKAAMIGFTLGWSGISQHLQVQAIVRHTDMRYWPFLLQRFVHAVLAFIMTFALWKPLQAFMPRIEISSLHTGLVYEAYASVAQAAPSTYKALAAWLAIPGRLEEMIATLCALALLSLIIGFTRSRLR